MSVDKFYEDVDNCIQAIVYKFGVPDNIAKYKNKINFYYGEKVSKRTLVELVLKDKMYVLNVSGKKAYFDIKETEYYQNTKKVTK